MSFSIRLTTEEKSLAESYAKLHSMSVGEAFKKLSLKKLKMNMILLLLILPMMNTSEMVKRVSLFPNSGRN